MIYGATSHNLYRFQWYWTAGFNIAAYACLQKRMLQETARRVRPGQPALGCYQGHALRMPGERPGGGCNCGRRDERGAGFQPAIQTAGYKRHHKKDP